MATLRNESRHEESYFSKERRAFRHVPPLRVLAVYSIILNVPPLGNSFTTASSKVSQVQPAFASAVVAAFRAGQSRFKTSPLSVLAVKSITADKQRSKVVSARSYLSTPLTTGTTPAQHLVGSAPSQVPTKSFTFFSLSNFPPFTERFLTAWEILTSCEVVNPVVPAAACFIG